MRRTRGGADNVRGDVYVTSRTTPGPPAGKVVVAIGFLPKKP